ncbi:MAG: J domain-containing protein [Deltaproteobacteria bacterium]|nr:J domain-containing protein [Deltaproteobacteria bacterium]
MTDDPFATLGVSRDASEEEIRAAYKRLAKALHPDVRPDDPDAAAKFRKIREAYQRARSLRAGRAESRGPQRRASEARTEGERRREDLKEVFEEVLKTKRREYEARRPTRRPTASKEARGRSEGIVRVPFEAAVKGGEHFLEVERDGRPVSRMKVSLPAGLSDGELLRIEGTIFRAEVGHHEFLRREDDHVILDLPLTIAELTLGADVVVPTVDGLVELVVPAGTRPGHRLRLRNKGVSGRGDQFCVVDLVLPDLRKGSVRGALEALDGEDDRSPRPWDPSGAATGTRLF